MIEPAMQSEDDARIIRAWKTQRRREMVVLGDFVVDAYVGTRTWRVRVEGGRAELRSVYMEDVVWPPDDAVEAECRCNLNPRIEDSVCTCGIYAFSEIDGVPNLGAPITWGRRAMLQYEGYVHGEVHLWGTVHHHATGYRAQFARPAAFYTWAGMSAPQKLRAELVALQFDRPMVVV